MFARMKAGTWTKRSLCALFVLVMLLPFVVSAQVGFSPQYSYTFDYWGELRHSPDPYRVRQVLFSRDLGLSQPLSGPRSLFVKGQHLYIVDSGNNRILQLLQAGGGFQVERIIQDFTGGQEPFTFSQPSDIFVMESGEMFICDTGNQRVLKLDAQLQHLQTLVKPSDQTFDQRLAFLPTRVVADSSGRAYVLARNVNKGLAKFETDGSFTGFIGAMPVSFTIQDQFWRLVSTRQQREQQASFVPTEFDNMYIDEKGFIYSVTSTFSEYDLLWDKARPIRKLNALGVDILVKNGELPPIGDIDWGSAGGISGPSKFSDITVLDNQVYIALDRTRGRLFGYDDQGRLLFAFGGSGNMAGYFRAAVSIEHMGKDLLVLDERENSVTIFTPTQYGKLIYSATESYLAGDYAASSALWQQVLGLNGNFELAYIGVGRALLQQGDYQQAMRYFKLADDGENYSRAFQEYRKIWVEDNISWIFLIIAALLVLPLLFSRIRKIREELKEA